MNLIEKKTIKAEVSPIIKKGQHAELKFLQQNISPAYFQIIADSQVSYFRFQPFFFAPLFSCSVSLSRLTELKTLFLFTKIYVSFAKAVNTHTQKKKKNRYKKKAESFNFFMD